MRFTKQVSPLSALCALSSAVLVGLLTSGADAQVSGASDWDGSPAAEKSCVPKCRSGYQCRQGECIPICDPPCGPGYLCSAGGSCVSTQPVAPVATPAPTTRPTQTWGGNTNQCLPSCRSGYVCLSGQCVTACNPACPVGEMCTPEGECVPGSDPGQPMSTPVVGAPLEERSSSADSIVNFHFDAAGLLQFGLTPTLEIGKRFSGYVRIRPLNTGLASYFLFAPDEGDKFVWGLGAALGMHIFSNREENMRGVFGGPALEYAFVHTKNKTRGARTEYGDHVLIPELDLGYRWGFNNFLLGVGGRLGVTIPVGHWKEGCSGSFCDDDRDVLFLAGVFVDIGWFF